MAGHRGEAWTDFEYRKAQELDSWQTTADTNYKTYVSSLANDEVTYATTDSSKFLSEAQTIDAADETDGDGAADADQALVNTLASDEVTYETAASTATAAWQTSMAQAAHDNVVAIANAIDTYAHDGNTTNYNSALAAAATALATAQTNAATTYSKAIGPATATQETNDANATLTDVQTDAGADLTDAKTADLQIDTYSNAESDAFDAQTKSDAQAFDTLEKGDADSLATDAAYQDGQYPSPRMDYWKAQTAAEDAKDDANADATLTQTGTTSDAQDTQEKTAANAEQTKDDNAAQSAHDKTVNDAQAVHDKAIADANSITAAVAKNAYTATLPGPYAAFDWSQMTDPSILDAGYDELYAVDDLPLSLAAGQDDGASPLPGGDVIGSPTSSPQSPAPSSAPALGQAFSLAGTVDPYGSISGMTTFTGPSLLWDNGAYAPANPNLGYAGWAGAPRLNVGQTLPTSGGGGSPTMPPPQTPGGGGGSGSGSGSGSGGSGSGNAPNESVPPTNPEAVRQTADNIEADATREYKPGFAKLQFLGNDKVLLELPKEGKRPDGWDGGIGIPFTNREFVWKSWRWGDNGERTGMTLEIIPKDRGVSPKTEAAAIGTAKAAGVVGATALAAAVVVTVTPEALAASGIVIATGQVLVIIGVTDGAGRVVASIPVLMDADSTPAQIEEATFNLLTGGSEVVGGGLFAAKGGFKPGPLGYGNADYNLYGVPPGHEIVDLA